MTALDKDFLQKIVETGSPTGREQALQRYLMEWAQPFADKIEADLVGNMAVIINPDAEFRVLLAAHCDRIGFMVMDVTKDGFIMADPLGGIDEATVLGSQVIIHSKSGDITGIFGKVSTHLQSKTEQDNVKNIDQMWIDIGAKNDKEVLEKISIGDYISYKPDMIELDNNHIAVPGLDNMLGVYAIMHTAKRCKERGIDVALYCVSTVQEELGARGAEAAASAIQPNIAIAVDTTLARDTPGKVKKETLPKIALGQGPSIIWGPNGNPIVTHRLREVGRDKEIPFQMEPNPQPAGNDAKTMQTASSGTAAGSVGIPIRNMHTQVELFNADDLESSIQLLTEFVCSLKPEMDFMPISHNSKGKKVKEINLGLLGEKKK